MERQRKKLPSESVALMDSLPFELHGYKFTETIGSGAFAVIFKCSQISINRFFAAKAINLNFEDEEDHSINVCESELKALVHLNHPNIIKIYDYFRENGHLFLILQLCENGNLQSQIKPLKGIENDILLSYMKQILEAVAFSHKNKVAHRDIKPHNVFIDDFNRPLLADFGFALFHENDEPLKKFCGSLHYRAPETIKKLAHDPFKADIWSLGVTFYEMATGSSPWPTYSNEALQKAIVTGAVYRPDRLQKPIYDIIKKMLCVDPEMRLSAQDLLNLPVMQKVFTAAKKDNMLINKSMSNNIICKMINIAQLGPQNKIPAKVSSVNFFACNNWPDHHANIIQNINRNPLVMNDLPSGSPKTFL